MSQKSVPIADVGTPTGWSTPVWSKTNALKSGDPDYTASSSDPAGDTFVVQLGAFGVPPPTERPFRVNVRARATAGGALLVTLLQGSTVIASRVLSPGTTFENEPFDLTDSEIGRINYVTGTTTFKLEAKAYAPSPLKCDCTECAMGVPLNWLLIISGITNGTCSNCLSYNGSFVLKYRGSCIWTSDEFDVCGSPPGLVRRYWLNRTTVGWILQVASISEGGPWSEYQSTGSECVTTLSLQQLFTWTTCANAPSTVSLYPMGGVTGVCTTCCNPASIPNVVFVTFSSCSPSTCDSESVPFSYRSGTNDWRPDSNPACGTFAANTRLVCDSGTFKYGDSSLVSLTTTSCNPLQLSGTGFPAPGGGTCSLTITI